MHECRRFSFVQEHILIQMLQVGFCMLHRPHAQFAITRINHITTLSFIYWSCGFTKCAYVLAWCRSGRLAWSSCIDIQRVHVRLLFNLLVKLCIHWVGAAPNKTLSLSMTTLSALSFLMYQASLARLFLLPKKACIITTQKACPAIMLVYLYIYCILTKYTW